MKLLRLHNDRYIFHLGKPESELLTIVLRLYPVIPPAHQRLSKSAAAVNEANQRLLDEALAEQRTENKKFVESFLTDAKRFQVEEVSTQMTVTAGEIEWLLQVLNDVRVGNWVLLGSPTAEPLRIAAKDVNAPRLWAMELAAMFQMNLIRALNKKPPGVDQKTP